MTFQRRLEFGRDRDPGVVEEAIERGAARTKGGTLRANPLIPLVGPGPEGAICGDCTHLFRVGGVAGRYYKCDLRRVTSGAATDHRVNWPACARFDPDLSA